MGISSYPSQDGNIANSLSQLQTETSTLGDGTGTTMSSVDRLTTAIVSSGSAGKKTIKIAQNNVGAVLDNLAKMDGNSSNATLRACATAAAVLASSTASAAVCASPTALHYLPDAFLVANPIGTNVYGGYVVGIIDTTRGNIMALDVSQVGVCYVLIVSPISSESTGLVYQSTASFLGGAMTRWDGLAATQSIGNRNLSTAASYVNGLSFPSDGGSQWYMPALDEIELMYRAFKPTTDTNYLGNLVTGGSWGSIFPPAFAQQSGYNPSALIPTFGYSQSVPAQTSVAAFQSGGAQALTSGASYWSSTVENATQAWYLYTSSTSAGQQSAAAQTGGDRVRPVRRILL